MEPQPFWARLRMFFATATTKRRQCGFDSGDAFDGTIPIDMSLSRRFDGEALRRMLPSRLYQSTTTTTTPTCQKNYDSHTEAGAGPDPAPRDHVIAKPECVVCLSSHPNAIPVHGGHIACCSDRLQKIRKKRDGCPICRARIAAVVLLE